MDSNLSERLWSVHNSEGDRSSRHHEEYVGIVYAIPDSTGFRGSNNSEHGDAYDSIYFPDFGVIGVVDADAETSKV
jgi:hypothetical protein